MKKFFRFLAVAGAMAFSANIAFAQDEMSAADLLSGSEQPLNQALKQKFIEGGPAFMSLIIICLIIGLALAIERILYLSFSKINTKKLVESVEEALKEGGIEKAKDVCRDTRGPVASIFYQGLLRYDQGLDVVEKTIVSYGSVQQSQLESGLSWISLFIAIAPSLGFLGTVIGMINLITTVGGLIVAMILQVFYNYILAKIESITIDMEDSSISLIDVLTKYGQKK